MASAVPLCVPLLAGNERRYLEECIETGWVSSVGPFVSRLEEMTARYLGRRYAVATSSGTAALHMALLVSGVQPEDEVIVPSLTFVAPVNTIRYVGAYPVFMDADPQTWQMDPQKTRDFIVKECEWKNPKLCRKSTKLGKSCGRKKRA